MWNMFSGATAANPNVSNWNTANVTNMIFMFAGTTAANPNVSNWNTTNVTFMYGMFQNATAANPNVSNWNTANVTDMSYMFQNATAANPNVSNWNTANVILMYGMFQNATAAKPDISLWSVKSLSFDPNFNSGMGLFLNAFQSQSLSTSVYSSFLIKAEADLKAQGGKPKNIPMDMGVTKYSAAAKPARDYLISLGWVITDGGQQ